MITKRLLAVGATALAGILIAPAALAVPTDEEIDSVRGQAEQTRTAITQIEVDLARSSALLDEATLRTQVAAEAYNAAQEDLSASEREAEAAQEELADALADLDQARALVGGIAMSAYRNGGNFGQLSMFLEADGISTAISAANTYSILGDHADGAQQQLDAATVAADLAKERAEAAVEEQQRAAEALNAAHAQTALEEEAAQQEMNRISAEQGALIAELAQLRGTTVEMERERQEHLDEQRRERESRAAHAELQRSQESEQRDTRESPPQASRATPRPASSPSPAEASTPAPSATSSPAPSRTEAPTPSAPATPTPRPTATPTPRPTATPTPRPTATPTPRPTADSAPAPTPTPTQKPKPKPTPTQKPKPKPPASSGAGATALAWAKTQIGKPYVWGSAGPNSYDCSGLTMSAFKQAGVNLPRNSAAQYSVGTKVPVGQMQAGDLFFYSRNGAQSGIYHVAIYAGNGMRLHAPSPGKTVELVPMWWANVLPNAVRL